MDRHHFRDGDDDAAAAAVAVDDRLTDAPALHAIDELPAYLAKNTMMTIAEFQQKHPALAKMLDLKCTHVPSSSTPAPAPAPAPVFHSEPSMPAAADMEPDPDDLTDWTLHSMPTTATMKSIQLHGGNTAAATDHIMARLDSAEQRNLFRSLVARGDFAAELAAQSLSEATLDGILDRVRNAWRAIRGKAPLPKKKKKKAEDEDEAADASTKTMAREGWAKNYLLKQDPAAAAAVVATPAVPLDGFLAKLRGIGQRLFGIGGKPVLLHAVADLTDEPAALKLGTALLEIGKEGANPRALNDPLPTNHWAADKNDRQLISISVTKQVATKGGSSKSSGLLSDVRAKYNAYVYEGEYRVVHVLMPQNAPRQITKADFFASVGSGNADVGNEVRFDLGSATGGFVNVQVDGQYTMRELTEADNVPMAAVWAGRIPRRNKVIFLLFETNGGSALNAPKSHRLHSVAVLTLSPNKSFDAAALAVKQLSARLDRMIRHRGTYTEAVVRAALSTLAQQPSLSSSSSLAVLTHANDVLATVLASDVGIGAMPDRERRHLLKAAVLADTAVTDATTPAQSKELATQLRQELIALAEASQDLGDPSEVGLMLATHLRSALTDLPAPTMQCLGNVLHACDAMLNGLADGAERLEAFWCSPLERHGLYAISG
jgi:hypothetical protein